MVTDTPRLPADAHFVVNEVPVPEAGEPSEAAHEYVTPGTPPGFPAVNVIFVFVATLELPLIVTEVAILLTVTVTGLQSETLPPFSQRP